LSELDHEEREFGAGETRQGEIILRTRRRRVIFIAGLVGSVLLVLIVRFAAFA
jgi:hypothetical protein